MIISDFPTASTPAEATGFPEFTFSGEYSILDDGSESGEKKVAFLTSGTLTLLEAASGITIQAQGGGGGGGAGSESSSGADGADGNIESYNGNLSAGEYSISIGAAGSAGSQGAGGAGGASTFSDILSAGGGAGGAYKGDVTRSHSGLYDTYGQGGQGGTPSMYEAGGNAPQYYIVANKDTYGYAQPNASSTVVNIVTAQSRMYLGLVGTDPFPTTITGTDGKQYYATPWATPEYYPADDFGSVQQDTPMMTERYYGIAGNPGIVIMSGKV